jgi:hypothetical protein
LLAEFNYAPEADIRPPAISGHWRLYPAEVRIRPLADLGEAIPSSNELLVDGLTTEQPCAMTNAATTPCAFCRTPVGRKNRAREDFWPTWSHNLPLMAQAALKTEMFPASLDSEQSVGRILRHRKGRPAVRDRNRNICKDCNNGWMSRLQAPAERLRSVFETGEGRLTGNQQAELAMWAAMTGLVMEQQLLTEPLRMAEQRHLWMKNRRAMRGVGIWVASYGGTQDVGRYFVQRFRPLSTNEPGAFVLFALERLIFVCFYGLALVTERGEPAVSGFQSLHPPTGQDLLLSPSSGIPDPGFHWTAIELQSRLVTNGKRASEGVWTATAEQYAKVVFLDQADAARLRRGPPVI